MNPTPTKIMAAPTKSKGCVYEVVPIIIIPLITATVTETLSCCIKYTSKTSVTSIETPVTIINPHWNRLGTTRRAAGKNIGNIIDNKNTN